MTFFQEPFQNFTVKKTRLPLPAARLSCLLLMFIWFSYMDAKCKEGSWKNVSSHRKFLIYAAGKERVQKPSSC